MGIDTACSSSLVAIHLANDGIFRQHTAYAVAGGVNALLSPLTTTAICQMHVSG